MLAGRYVDEKFPIDFLSQCFNYGMKNNKDGVIHNILPIYDPTDEQIKLFHMLSGPYVYNANDYKKEKKDRLEQGLGSENIIKITLLKYRGDISKPGINKFIHRLAEHIFIE